MSRLRPCHEGPNNEPCRQCQKLVTGDHVKVVTTRRQAKLKPLFAPVFQTDGDVKAVTTRPQAKIKLLFAPVFQPDVITATNSDDDSCANDDNNDDCDDDVIDNTVFSPPDVETQEGCNDRQPVGLLGRTAPNAAANIDGWDPDMLRGAQLQDPDIASVLTAVENDTKPPRRELQSFSSALRALFLQYDSLVVVGSLLYRVFYANDGKKGKDVDLYSAFHAPGTPNAHVTETRPPDRLLGHRPACNTQPVQ